MELNSKELGEYRAVANKEVEAREYAEYLRLQAKYEAKERQ